MTEREMCEFCNDFDADSKCDYKDKCKFIALVRENKKLKAEKRELKKKLKEWKNAYEELRHIRSWEISPYDMGR